MSESDWTGEQQRCSEAFWSVVCDDRRLGKEESDGNLQHMGFLELPLVLVNVSGWLKQDMAFNHGNDIL